MFIRPRKLNLSLERPVYVPAQKDAAGKLVTLPKRSTEYLGSVKAYIRYSEVPHDLLAKLNDAEREQLRAELLKNEPRADATLAGLPQELKRAAKELATLAKDASPETLAHLKTQLKAAEDAWATFFKTAQAAGLRRTVHRAPKAAAAAKKPVGTKAAKR